MLESFGWCSKGSLASAVAVALFVGGCDDGSQPAPATERNAAIDDFAATPPPRRGRLIRPEAVTRSVLWPDEAPVRTAALDRLDRLTLDQAPVPVLVPSQFDGEANLATGDTWYAFSARSADVEITLQGSAQGRLIPGIRAAAPTHTIRGDNPGFVTRNEGIWSVSWTEHGAAYSLEVSCAEPFAERCNDEQFALDWVDQLVLGGGQGVQR